MHGRRELHRTDRMRTSTEEWTGATGRDRDPSSPRITDRYKQLDTAYTRRQYQYERFYYRQRVR